MSTVSPKTDHINCKTSPSPPNETTDSMSSNALLKGKSPRKPPRNDSVSKEAVTDRSSDTTSNSDTATNVKQASDQEKEIKEMENVTFKTVSKGAHSRKRKQSVPQRSILPDSPTIRSSKRIAQRKKQTKDNANDDYLRDEELENLSEEEAGDEDENEEEEEEIVFYKKGIKQRKTTPKRPVFIKVCLECGYRTYHKLHFCQHVLTQHSKETPLLCFKCSYKGKIKSNIKQHMKRAHGCEATAEEIDAWTKAEQECFGKLLREYQTEVETDKVIIDNQTETVKEGMQIPQCKNLSVSNTKNIEADAKNSSDSSSIQDMRKNIPNEESECAEKGSEDSGSIEKYSEGTNIAESESAEKVAESTITAVSDSTEKDSEGITTLEPESTEKDSEGITTTEPESTEKDSEANRRPESDATENDTGGSTCKSFLNLLKCPMCSFENESGNILLKHLAKEHDKFPQVCDECGEKFGLTSDLMSHMETQHPGLPVSDGRMQEYEELEGKLKKFVGKELLLKVKSAAPLISKNKTTQLYHCEFCDYKSGHKSHFKDHLSVHSSEREFGCPECKKKFKTKHYLNQHRQAFHTKEEITCKDCGKTFLRLYSYHVHRRHRCKVMETPCDICGKVCASEYQFKRHRKIHSKEKKSRVQCPECHVTLSNTRNLQSHIDNVHKKAKRYDCKECDRSFYLKKDIKLHMQRHKGEKQHKCSDCPKAFYTQQELKQHQLVHTGEKPFACKHCGDTFRDRSTRTRHELRHQENRPSYSCTICGNIFNRKDNLIAHLKKKICPEKTMGKLRRRVGPRVPIVANDCRASDSTLIQDNAEILEPNVEREAYTFTAVAPQAPDVQDNLPNTTNPDFDISTFVENVVNAVMASGGGSVGQTFQIQFQTNAGQLSNINVKIDNPTSAKISEPESNSFVVNIVRNASDESQMNSDMQNTAATTTQTLLQTVSQEAQCIDNNGQIILPQQLDVVQVIQPQILQGDTQQRDLPNASTEQVILLQQSPQSEMANSATVNSDPFQGTQYFVVPEQSGIVLQQVADSSLENQTVNNGALVTIPQMTLDRELNAESLHSAVVGQTSLQDVVNNTVKNFLPSSDSRNNLLQGCSSSGKDISAEASTNATSEAIQYEQPSSVILHIPEGSDQMLFQTST